MKFLAGSDPYTKAGTLSSAQAKRHMKDIPHQSELPLISIVIPSYNQGEFLAETLESIFRQDYPCLEVMVIDGGSTDGSIGIIREYEPRLAYWRSRPDDGQTDAINEGIERCRGTLVAWLNSDDFYWKDALWTVARAYMRFPGRGLYIGNGLRYDQAKGTVLPFCPRHVALHRRALKRGLDYVLQPSTFFLRQAWSAVGGLNPHLQFCMDWDIILRISERYPAVLINEFLGVSREYRATKTSSGKMERAVEILRMVKSHTGAEITPGSLAYFLETLADLLQDCPSQSLSDGFCEEARQGVAYLQGVINREFARDCGNADGFPETVDSQDDLFLPFPQPDDPHPPRPAKREHAPRISIITPSLNQGRFIQRTLQSVLNQGYPNVELIVCDGGSTDGTLDVLDRYREGFCSCTSEPDSGPAQAVNKGFERASGEILAWLNSDDMLATGALWEVAAAFSQDPDLDMVFANALYIDEDDRLVLADHGTQRTGLYYGKLHPKELVPAYWRYVHAVPQPTVFFRRRLLQSCGPLDESYHYIFDFELFWRFLWKAKIAKIEKTLAFYRIHREGKTADWGKFQAELYRFSRPWWPGVTRREFQYTLRDFLRNFMQRHFPELKKGWRFRLIAAAAGISATIRLGNPEAAAAILHRRKPRPSDCAFVPAQLGRREPSDLQEGASKAALPISLREAGTQMERKYKSLFCSYTWPRHPGHSGGEIRDFHLLCRLLRRSSVEFFALYDYMADERGDLLLPYVEAVHTPNTMAPDRFVQRPAFLRFKQNLLNRLRSRNIPVLGPKYHHDVALGFQIAISFSLATLQETLEKKNPDFFFVSPQSNPVAMAVRRNGLRTRLVLASYDVEAVRMERLARSHRGAARLALLMEARRARRYENLNLRHYDGIIAVSDLDKRFFVEQYGYPPERVLVIDNGVDTEYFDFHPRSSGQRPEIVFVGSFTYTPNLQAAWRLKERIMPMVWRTHPRARLWVVGQGADENLKAQSDGARVLVTGRVKDVRPYLRRATLGCIPLISGSGTKYKVLEAMSAGVPLVCTPLALEGLEIAAGEEALVGETDEQLAGAILRLIAEPEFAAAMASRARRRVNHRYGWNAVLPPLDTWLDELTALPGEDLREHPPDTITV